MPELDAAAIWKSAEQAIVVGDDGTLGRLLAEHDRILRTARPPEAWFDGLTPNDKAQDARALIAREHYCESWPQYRELARQVNDRSSLVAGFERSADAIAAGDETLLSRLLKERPQLIRARSIRSHHSTLLHYVGANGIESWRQRTPKNAVRIADILIDAGAEVDAEADMYNGGCTTLGLVATSCHPRDAGVQTALIDILIAHGARVDAPAGGHNDLIVNSCRKRSP